MQRRTAFTLIELIVVIIIIALLTALLLPAIRAARETAKGARCVNYLRQIGLSYHNYHDTHGPFPPAYHIDEAERPLYSWRVNILPFVEQQKLYDIFHLDESWDSGHNQALFENRPWIYACPQQHHFKGRPGDCPYGMIVGPNTISNGPNAVTIPEITDGTSNTILVAETRKNMPWSSPTDISFASLAMGVLKRNDSRALENGISSRHRKEETAVVFADGSVRMLSPKIKPEILQALATINGGEKVDSEW